MPDGLWWAAAALVAAYVALFVLARRPVSLRPARVAAPLLAALALRLLLLACGWALEGALDVGATAASAALAAALLLFRRVWLLRARAADLAEQVRDACRGLFLKYEEPQPGRFVLTARGGSRSLRVRALGGRLLAVALPGGPPGKFALLVHWLSKQYPGPVPRATFVLSTKE
jgi:hypothetical protein